MKKQVKLGIAVGTFTVCVILKSIFPDTESKEVIFQTSAAVPTGKTVVNTINLAEYL